jgi:hypothetical protein
MSDQSGPPRENCPAPPSVRCFRGTYAPNGRKPIWAMTGENTGAYFSEMVNHWYTPMMSLAQLEQAHEELSPAAALAELADWPEAQRELRAMILESLPKPAHSEYDVLCGMGVVGPPMREPTPAPLKPLASDLQAQRHISDCHEKINQLQQVLTAAQARITEFDKEIESLQSSFANTLANINDTCRSRGFTAGPSGKSTEDRVIALAQAYDSLQADRAALAERLKQGLMNLQPRKPETRFDAAYYGSSKYLDGHKDARHAAVEFVMQEFQLAAATLVEGAGEETKGEPDHARPK